MRILWYIVGYAVSLVGGTLVIKPIVDALHKKSPVKIERRVRCLGMYTGICERILYTTVILMGFETFIPLWLLVKVGRGWRVPWRMSEESEERETIPPADVVRFNVFLIGNALSVIFGVLGALIIKQWAK